MRLDRRVASEQEIVAPAEAAQGETARLNEGRYAWRRAVRRGGSTIRRRNLERAALQTLHGETTDSAETHALQAG